MDYTYARISHVDQNPQRQVNQAIGKLFLDKISGTTKFLDRPQASKLYDKLRSGDTLHVEHVDRLGRDTIDILETLRVLQQKDINVHLTTIGISSLNDDGSPNYVFKICCTFLATMAESERERSRERQMQGIRIAQIEGKYRGKKSGATMDFDKWTAKNADIIEGLKSGLKIQTISNMTGRGRTQVARVRDRYEAHLAQLSPTETFEDNSRELSESPSNVVLNTELVA